MNLVTRLLAFRMVKRDEAEDEATTLVSDAEESWMHAEK